MREIAKVRWLCWLVLLIAGCNSRNYDGPQRFPLSGKVSHDGKPIDWGSISFIPTADVSKDHAQFDFDLKSK